MTISGTVIFGVTHTIPGTPVGTLGHRCMATVTADIMIRIMYRTGDITTITRDRAAVISHKHDVPVTVISFSPVVLDQAVGDLVAVQQ